MAKELDFSGIFENKAAIDEQNRDYARRLRRDAARDKLKEQFVSTFVQESVFDGPARRRKDIINANLASEELRNNLRTVNQNAKQAKFEEDFKKMEMIGNNSDGVEAGARKVATQVFNNTKVGELLLGRQFGNGYEIPKYELESLTEKKESILDDMTQDILSQYNEMQKLGTPTDFALRAGNYNIDLYNLGSSVGTFKGDKAELFGNVFGGTDRKIAEALSLQNQIENKLAAENKIVERGLISDKFLNSENFNDIKNSLSFSLKINKEDVKSLDIQQLFTGTSSDSIAIRKSILSLPDGILKDEKGSVVQKGFFDDKGFYLTTNKDNFEIQERNEEGKIVKVYEGEYTLENVLYNDLKPIAVALFTEYQKAGEAAAPAQKYFNQAFKLLVDARYIEQSSEGKIIYKRPKNINNQISSIQNLSKNERSKLLVDRLKTIGGIAISGTADLTINDFVEESLKITENKINTQIETTTDLEEKDKLYIEKDKVNLANTDDNQKRKIGVVNIINPPEELKGKNVAIDSKGTVYEAGNLSFTQALELYEKKLINDSSTEDTETLNEIINKYLPNLTGRETKDLKANLRKKIKFQINLQDEDFKRESPPSRIEFVSNQYAKAKADIINLEETQGTKKAFGEDFVSAVGTAIASADERASINRIQESIAAIDKRFEKGDLSISRTQSLNNRKSELQKQLEELLNN